MIKFIITSDAFEGEAIITYNENGEHPMPDVFNTNMREDQHKWFLGWVCEKAINHDMIVQTINTSKTNLHFQQMNVLPAFNDFWAAYFKGRYKDNSSKKKSEARWNKMSEGTQLAAYNYISRYFSQIPSGTQPKLAETYLSSEVWVK